MMTLASAAAIFAAAIASGCGDGLVVSQLAITGTPDGWRSPGLNPVVLQTEIVEAGKRDGAFTLKRGAKGGWNMKVGLEHLPEAFKAASGHGGAAIHGIEIKLQRYLNSGDFDSMALSIPITEGDAAAVRDSATKERVIAGLIAKGALQLKTQIEFRKLETSGLVRELASKEAWRRSAAIEELGLRKEKGSIRKVINELKDPERSVSMKAVGALVSMANPESVPALIEYCRGKDTATQVQVIYAIAQIGGPDAIGYLFVVSTGHPDRSIAAAAAEALGDIEGRKAE